MHLVMWWIMDDPYTKIQLLSYYGLSVACIIPLFELIFFFFIIVSGLFQFQNRKQDQN